MKYRVFGAGWTEDVEVKNGSKLSAKWAAIENRADRFKLKPAEVLDLYSKTFFIVERRFLK